MPFWTYMLHCRGGYLYVGHTDDLEKRIGAHQSGLIPGFTADHQPVELVWSDVFTNREDAKAAERKLKGWSRAKKLALIRGDWEKISALGRKKDSASTSSAWTGETNTGSQNTVRPDPAEVLSLSLQPHPDHPADAIRSIKVSLSLKSPNWLVIRWKIDGAMKLVVPPLAGKGRADRLWQTTCFELFVKAPGGEGYAEFNLSPSERWAAYDFTGYREGMSEHAMARQPDCTLRKSTAIAIFDGAIPMAALPPMPWSANLTAVLEEEGGVKSYWALAHPPGKPDFHDPACFVLAVPAPEAA